MPAPDTQILSRVVMLQTADRAGAGFVVDRRKRKWLVTASHVVPDEQVLELDLVYATGRSSTALTRLPAVPRAADIAVFALEADDVDAHGDLELSNTGLLMGQEVHLFGYPLIGYGNWRTDTGGTLPFIRSGCMGGTMSQAGTRMLLVDALSDAGMAGGPVTFAHDRKGKAHVAGVIIDPDAGGGGTSPAVVPHFPLGITQVASIDHVNDTIDAWKGR